jgi:Tol biopolymer transport system component
LDPATSTLYFVRSNPSFSGWRIMSSRCRGGRWSEPSPVGFAGDGVEADPFITRDGLSLYFISTRSENGVRQRELDIWRVDRRRRSDPWGSPQRLPEPINSPGAEWFPRPAVDGWLYFGSNRPGGRGGTDIYRARREQGAWRVENLGEAVNGPGDEYEAEISPDGRQMLLMADGDLFLLTRNGEGWTGRRKLDAQVNTSALEVGPTFAPDGRSFLFARDMGAAGPSGGASGELMLASMAAGGMRAWRPPCA